MTIPVIDLSRYLHGGAGDRRAVARETDRVCRETGFLSVIGHGVPESTINNLYAVTKAFFHQPFTTKIKVCQPGAAIVRGYIGMGKGALASTMGETTPPDLKETYNVGPEGRARAAPNLWPENDPAFRAAFLAYYAEMDRLGLDLMRLFAEALDLEPGHFDGAFGHHQSVLSAMYYPDQPEPPREGQLRAGAHTDFGTLTILRPDNAPGGLQLKTKAGDWLPARAAKDSFVINIGDMMARWTNDSYWLVAPLKLRDEGVTLKYGGKKTVDGREFEVLDVTFVNVGMTSADHYIMYIDPKTSLLVKWDYMPAPDKKITSVWEDYRDFNGLKLATKHDFAGKIIKLTDVTVDR